MAKQQSVEQQLAEILNGYTDDIKKALNTEAEAVAKSTAEKLKSSSPKRKAKYASGWGIERQSKGLGSSFVVRNKKYYRLTHLLEKGHALKNGGRTKAQPHIKPAEEQAIKEYYDRVKGWISK